MEDTTSRDHTLAAWARNAGARVLVLFGSEARGEPGLMGDLDLAVGFSSLPGPQRRLELLNEIQALVGSRTVDLVFLHRDTDPVLRFEIFSAGRALYEAEPGVMVEECVRAMKEFADALPFRRLLRGRLQEMAKEGTLVP